MRRFRRHLSHFAIEALLIFLSVIVALAANNWKARHDNLARAAEARSAFIREIEANRAMLLSDAILPHHRRLQATYAKALEAHAPDPHALFETGLHPATFGDAAWRGFSTSTIFSDFAVDEVLPLSELYHKQAEIERRDEAFILAVSSPRADRETPEYQRDATGAITLFLNDLVPAEEHLVTRYDQVLDRLRRAQ